MKKTKEAKPVKVHPGIARKMTPEEWGKYNKRIDKDVRQFLYRRFK